MINYMKPNHNECLSQSYTQQCTQGNYVSSTTISHLSVLCSSHDDLTPAAASSALLAESNLFMVLDLFESWGQELTTELEVFQGQFLNYEVMGGSTEGLDAEVAGEVSRKTDALYNVPG